MGVMFSRVLSNLAPAALSAGEEEILRLAQGSGAKGLDLEGCELISKIRRGFEQVERVPLDHRDVMFRQAFAPGSFGDVAIGADQQALEQDGIHFLRRLRQHPRFLSFVVETLGIGRPRATADLYAAYLAWSVGPA